MKIFISAMMSCAAFKSDILPDLQSVYDKVNNQMIYDSTLTLS